MLPRANGRRRIFAALLSIGVSGLFLYLAVRKTDLLDIRKALSGVNLRWLLPIVVIALVDFWLRAVRWSWMSPSNARPAVLADIQRVHDRYDDE